MKEILKVKDLYYTYQALNSEVEALQDINFEVGEGEFVSVVGPSGCGKSTLLSIIAGILNPTKGEIILDGQKIDGINSKIAYMQQTDNLMDWKNIEKNILFGLVVQNKLNEKNKSYADRLIKTYGLDEFKKSYPWQLSGGMRQRAALIRTLAIKPTVILLDEAFSALDFQTRLSVTDDVRKILKDENVTSIMVTHDIPESVSMSDRVIVLSNRPGRIKNIHILNFDPDIPPLQRRRQPNFSEYFNQIWGELIEQ